MVKERPESNVHSKVARSLGAVLSATNAWIGLQFNHPWGCWCWVALGQWCFDHHSKFRQAVLAILKNWLDRGIAQHTQCGPWSGCTLWSRGCWRGIWGGFACGDGVTKGLKCGSEEGKCGNDHGILQAVFARSGLSDSLTWGSSGASTFSSQEQVGAAGKVRSIHG